MANRLFISCRMMIVFILLGLGRVTSVQSQPSESIGALRNAYATMAEADSMYSGHRAKAMKHTQAAVKVLKVKAARKSYLYDAQPGSDAKMYQSRVSHKPDKRDLSRPESDARLRIAKNILEQTSYELSGKPRKEVEGAIKEISLALNVP